jgi:outer membrane protein TolC
MTRTAGVLRAGLPTAAALILSLGGPAVAHSEDAPGDTLTLRECVTIARERAPAFLAARSEFQAAAYESIAVARERGPDWAITSDATIAPKGFYDPTVTDLGGYDLKLGFDWPVADGGKRMLARRRSGLDLAAARWQSIQTARDAGLRAGELAAELLRLREIAAAQIGAVEWSVSLGSLVKRGVTSGVRGVADSIRVGLERDASTIALESTLQEARTDELELLVLLDRDLTGHVVILHPPDADRAPGETDSLRLVASADRTPEVALAEVTAARGSLDLIEARRRNAATLDFTADAGLAGADLTSTVPEDLKATDPDATLTDRLRRDLGASMAFHFRMPVLDKSAARHTRAREESLRAARARVAAERGTQRRLALDLLSQWRFAYRRAELAERSHERAEDALLRVKSLYAAGATTLLDLLDARRVTEESRERLAEARRDARLAQLRAEDRE